MILALPLETKWRMVSSHAKTKKIDFSLSAKQYLDQIQSTLEVCEWDSEWTVGIVTHCVG